MFNDHGTTVDADGSGAMFDAVAERYDLLNRVLSLGLDRRWRVRLLDALAVAPGHAVLDVATGTGDVALAVWRREPRARVVGLDPSPGMLAVAERKARAARAPIGLALGTAEAPPFPPGSFDRVACAFGLRNFADRAAGLGALRRLLRPGGRLVILELARPSEGALARVAEGYVRHVVPRLGALASGPAAYRYLADSVLAFPPRAEVRAAIADAGFLGVTDHALSFSAAALYVAEVGP